MKKLKSNSKYLLLPIWFALLIALVIWAYNMSTTDTYVTGTVYTQTGVDDKFIHFNPFTLGVPVDMPLPSKYEFKDGDKVNCLIRTTKLWGGARHIELISVLKP